MKMLRMVFLTIPFTTEKNVYCRSFCFFFSLSHKFHVLNSFSNFGTCCCVFAGKTLKCDAISEWLPLNNGSKAIELKDHTLKLLLFVSITWFSPVVLFTKPSIHNWESHTQHNPNGKMNEIPKTNRRKSIFVCYGWICHWHTFQYCEFCLTIYLKSLQNDSKSNLLMDLTVSEADILWYWK